MNTFANLIDHLCKASNNTKHYFHLEWPAVVEPDQWYFSPELVSLYGTLLYDNLTEAEKKRLSFYEAVNFFSLNIHGERALIASLSQKLYQKETIAISSYLHHFLEEENQHMRYFAEFCLKYAGKIYQDRKVLFSRSYETGEEEFLFFAKVLIFEEVANIYNLQMLRDKRLIPITRQINLLHYRDEARHLIFGKQIVKEIFIRFSHLWLPETLERIQNYLLHYLKTTWEEYYNPDVYQDAGLKDPFNIRQQASRSSYSQKRWQEISNKCIAYFLKNNIVSRNNVLIFFASIVII